MSVTNIALRSCLNQSYRGGLVTVSFKGGVLGESYYQTGSSSSSTSFRANTCSGWSSRQSYEKGGSVTVSFSPISISRSGDKLIGIL